MSNSTENKRIGYFDFCRGIAIIMVVGIHTFVMSEPADATIFVRQILNCAVPIFLALSGYFATRQFINGQTTAIAFWKKQIPRVYIPCIIWSLPLYTEQLIKSGGNNLAEQTILLLVGGVSVYYFITLIIQYYLLQPLLVRYNNGTMLGITGAVSMLAIIAIGYIRLVKGIDLSLLVYAAPFTTWWVFYMLGVYMAQHSRQYSLSIAIIVVVAGLLLQCVESNYLMREYGEGLGIKPSSYIYSAGVILLLFNRRCETAYRNKCVFRLIEYCGRISLGIFLTHCYMIGVAKMIPFATIHWGVKWFVTLLLSVVFIWCINKILPNRLCRWIGFR